ncbi:APC family permease [Rhodococcus sp. 06-156-3C]|uniref:APC family permease n=1 Tax=Nocardiaceae TaxID=85025 RepID=UPI0006892E60|nr:MULTISPECIES: APC family permease [Rhodococcus]OZD18249.1 APC family permease [Rhodococcus sp. 06-156-4C]OZD18847.1 APC family permease [Rhodococcus sp. 06-156-3C]OZD22357.1 APC family permease [Rhodococcus sp. 06-156-4a]OZD33941.1 APC family permease [Rhodococcus sp. 06-156-3b]OZD38678.1 APC family permease [Rhodococcus sp. 06-156-3]
MSDPASVSSAGSVRNQTPLPGGHLSLTQLVSISLATFVPAVGIALAPSLLLRTAGPAAWSASLMSMIAIISLGLVVIAFAKRYVGTGSIYSYLGHVFGPWARLVSGAALLLGFALQTAAGLAIVGIFTGSFLYSMGVENAVDVGPQLVIYFIALLIATAVALRGLDTSIVVATIFTVVSLPLVLLITGSSVAHTGLELATQLDFTGFSLNATLQGVAAGASFLIGFEACTVLAVESKNPKRSIPFAVMSVPVVLGLLYLACTFAQMPGLIETSGDVEAGMSPTSALALNAGLGEGIAKATDLVLAISIFASLIGFINFGSRFAIALAQDNLLPSALNRVNKKYQSPFVAIFSQGALGLAAVLTLIAITGGIVSGYTGLATLIVYTWSVPYVLMACGAIKLMLLEKRWSPLLLVAAVVGAGVMIYSYLLGWIYPLPAPLDRMTWLFAVLIALILASCLVFRKLRLRKSSN